MDFEFLWLEILLGQLLWLAATTAAVQRPGRKSLKIAVIVCAGLVPGYSIATAVVATGFLKFYAHQRVNWFAYAVSLFIANVGGSLLIFYMAARSRADERAASIWRVISLFLTWVACLFLTQRTLMRIDAAIHARNAALSQQLQATILASLPATGPRQQNAATLYQQAFLQLGDPQSSGVKNPPVGDAESFDPTEPSSLAYLQNHQAALQLSRQAAEMPICRFDEKWLETTLARVRPELNSERFAADVLVLEAKTALSRDDVPLALTDLRALFKMSGQFAQKPLLIDALMGLGVQEMGWRALGEMLPSITDESQLSRLDLESRPPWAQALQRALIGEECLGLRMYDHFPNLTPDENQSPTSGSTWSLEADRATILRIFLINPDAYISTVERVRKLVDEPYYLVKNEARLIGDTNGGDILARLLTVSLNRMIETNARATASMRCAEVGVAATRYRLVHGDLPVHLSDLVPDIIASIPLDPFDGKPLRLAILPEGFIVYSVGPDGVDDGGKEIDRQGGDVRFVMPTKLVKRPATRAAG